MFAGYRDIAQARRGNAHVQARVEQTACRQSLMPTPLCCCLRVWRSRASAHVTDNAMSKERRSRSRSRQPRRTACGEGSVTATGGVGAAGSTSACR